MCISNLPLSNRSFLPTRHNYHSFYSIYHMIQPNFTKVLSQNGCPVLIFSYIESRALTYLQNDRDQGPSGARAPNARGETRRASPLCHAEGSRDVRRRRLKKPAYLASRKRRADTRAPRSERGDRGPKTASPGLWARGTRDRGLRRANATPAPLYPDLCSTSSAPLDRNTGHQNIIPPYY